MARIVLYRRAAAATAGDTSMVDLALVLTIVGFFALAFAYATGCDRLDGGVQ